MNQLLKELNTILEEKQFGEQETHLILECFSVLCQRYGKTSAQVTEYAQHIRALNRFKIINDVNDDPSFLKPLTRQQLDESRREGGAMVISQIQNNPEKLREIYNVFNFQKIKMALAQPVVPCTKTV